MGEETNRVEIVEIDVPARPDQLEHEVELIRGSLTGIVKELDQRWHDLLNWRLRVRQHRAALGVGAAGIVLLIGGVVIVGVVRKRRRERPMALARRLSEALGRIIDEPENIARPESGIGKKALASAAGAAAGILAKRLTQWITSSSLLPRKTVASHSHERVRV